MLIGFMFHRQIAIHRIRKCSYEWVAAMGKHEEKFPLNMKPTLCSHLQTIVKYYL